MKIKYLQIKKGSIINLLAIHDSHYLEHDFDDIEHYKEYCLEQYWEHDIIIAKKCDVKKKISNMKRYAWFDRHFIVRIIN